MLMITGQKPIKASKQGQFQIVDVVDMMRPLTKFTHQLNSPHNIPARVREAFRNAESERPGAVHLELPEDIAGEETDAQVIVKSRSEIPHASEGCIRAAVEMIEAAKHPLILIGAGANRKATKAARQGFVDKTGIPFLDQPRLSPCSPTAVSESHAAERWLFSTTCESLLDWDTQSTTKIVSPAKMTNETIAADQTM